MLTITITLLHIYYSDNIGNVIWGLFESEYIVYQGNAMKLSLVT